MFDLNEQKMLKIINTILTTAVLSLAGRGSINSTSESRLSAAGQILSFNKLL